MKLMPKPEKLLNRGNATEAAVSQTINRIHETVDLTTAQLANSTISAAKRQAAAVVLTSIVKDLACLQPLLPVRMVVVHLHQLIIADFSIQKLTQYDSFEDDFARFDYSISRLLLAVESSRSGVLAFVSQRVRYDRPLLVNLQLTLTLQTLNVTASVNGTKGIQPY